MAYSNKLDELIENMFRVWSSSTIIWVFVTQNNKKITKPNTCSESARIVELVRLNYM